jgi:hypothetical protein
MSSGKMQDGEAFISIHVGNIIYTINCLLHSILLSFSSILSKDSLLEIT